MEDIQLFHPRNNPSMLIPRIFIHGDDMPRMKPSQVHITRTIATPFLDFCRRLSDEKGRLIIQSLDDVHYWRIHVLHDGRVATSTTEDRTLLAAASLARQRLLAPVN